jgi:predicted Fe-Mo cluster-binding NifX family protein
MDVMNLYQEDAAKKMGVSRPTFTRILKSARNKLANAIVSGYKIVFEDSKKDEFIIAVCSSDEKTLDNIDPKQEFIHIYKVNPQEVLLLDVIVNPSFLETKKPAIVLPSIFLQNNVNIFISSKIGEGLKNSLISKGIRPIIKETLSLDELLKLF